MTVVMGELLAALDQLQQEKGFSKDGLIQVLDDRHVSIRQLSQRDIQASHLGGLEGFDPQRFGMLTKQRGRLPRRCGEYQRRRP